MTILLKEWRRDGELHRDRKGMEVILCFEWRTVERGKVGRGKGIVCNDTVQDGAGRGVFWAGQGEVSGGCEGQHKRPSPPSK